jgi:NADH-quinone oxidoreductase subunit E
MVMCNSCEKQLETKFADGSVDVALLEPIFTEYAGKAGSLISILQKTQELYGYLPLVALQEIADKTGNKRAKIYGIATFYSQFRLKPVGKYVILQCQGTACHVLGSKAIGSAICDELGIAPGETTADGLFTLEDVACLGCCSLAPVIMINGESYGKLTPDSVRKVLQNIGEVEKGGVVSET